MKNSEFDKEVIMHRLQSGDTKFYEQLYLVYYDKLGKYIFYLSQQKQLAEDIAQDTLIEFWQKRHTITITTNLNGYLYKSAYHRFIDQNRKKAKASSILEDLRREVVIKTENLPTEVKEERLKAMYKVIDALPEKRREIFVLSKLKNYKYKEIAEKLQISERTVESQIRKALITLREHLLTLITYAISFFIQ